jgi:excisionase family DNA binding protein
MTTLKPDSDDYMDLSGYEPYELSEISRIARKAEKDSGKLKTLDVKISHLTLAVEKISLIINNSLLANQIVEQEGHSYDTVDFWNQVDQAKSTRSRLELQIKELQLAKAEEAESGNPEAPINGAVSVVETSTPDLNMADEVMDVEGVAKYLKSSRSTIYHIASNREIPSVKMGGRRIFLKNQIDEWLQDRLKKNA